MSPPPPLAWLQCYCDSTGRALDQMLNFELRGDVNPLHFMAHIQWKEPVPSKLYLGIWNLFQIWAHKNGTVPLGTPLHAPFSMSISLATRERLGLPKKHHPMS